MRLSCDEATKICDKNQYGEAGLWEKIKLNIHIFLCKKCGLYSKQNRILTQCYKKHRIVVNKGKSILNKEEKMHLNKEIREKIKA